MKLSLKNFVTVFLVGIVYTTYSFFILTPSSYKNFSLIDDGQTIQNNVFFQKCITNFECNDLNNKVLTEKEFGRFRPAYWIINYSISTFTGLNPILQHEVRIFIIGLCISVLAGLVVMWSGGSVIGILSTIIFLMTSFSFTENIVRLGPAEPYQVIFIAIFLIFARLKTKFSFWIATVAFIISCLIKETSFIVALPFLVMSFLFSTEIKNRKLSIIYLISGLMIFIIGRVLANPTPGNLVYVENFQLNLSSIWNNSIPYVNLVANTTSPFLKIFILLFVISIILPNFRKIFWNRDVLLWFLTFIIFILILIPWKYILERYLLVSIFSFSILIGLIISNTQRLILETSFVKKSRLMYVVLLASFAIIVGNILTDSFSISLAKTLNYRIWYSTFLDFERDQIQAIVRANIPTVYIDAKNNLDNWEVLYELPIHLAYIYNNKTDLQRIDSLPVQGLIFTRTSLEASVSRTDLVSHGYKIVDTQNYSIKQINPLDFKKLFKMRPIKAFEEDGLNTSEITYSWSIYKK